MVDVVCVVVVVALVSLSLCVSVCLCVVSSCWQRKRTEMTWKVRLRESARRVMLFLVVSAKVST